MPTDLQEYLKWNGDHFRKWAEKFSASLSSQRRRISLFVSSILLVLTSLPEFYVSEQRIPQIITESIQICCSNCTFADV